MKKSSFDYEKRKRLLPFSMSDYITRNVYSEHLFEQTFHINFDILPKMGRRPIFGKPSQTSFYQAFPVIEAFFSWAFVVGILLFPQHKLHLIFAGNYLYLSQRSCIIRFCAFTQFYV